MQNVRRSVVGAMASGLMVLGAFAPASAASTVIVTQSDTQGWSTADTRPGGTVTFVADPTSPVNGNGALRLTTDATTTAKAQYLHGANEPLSGVTQLSYWTKQNSGPPHAAASYQLIVFLGGGSAGFTTLVFEPYQNGVVMPAVWQQWDVDAGQFWSTRSYSSGTCSVVAGGGGAPFYTLAQIQAMCPNAQAIGFGVNIGTNNPAYDVQTDFVDFNGTAYDFAYTNEPTDKDQCKKDGWMTLTDGQGQPFKNQGQCVSYANHT